MIRTKIYKPVVSREIVPRKNFMDLLDYNSSKSLILVIAPGGYGKSISISQWLDHKKKKYGWISSDRENDGLGAFVTYLIASIQEAFPNIQLQTEDLLSSIDQPPYDLILNTLVNDLDKIEDDFTLVLDDYHLIEQELVHRLVADLIKYSLENIQVVISGRTHPPFELGKLHIESKVAVIGVSDLQFSLTELKTLLKNLKVPKLLQEDYRILLTYTEGWIVSIRVIAEQLSLKLGVANVIKRLENDPGPLFDIFLEEALNKQPRIVQKYLLLTGLLNRFSVQLLDHVIDLDITRKEGAARKINFFRYLKKHNLFLIALDNSGEWYRYHHMFQEFLTTLAPKMLDEATIHTFYKNASEWLSNRDWVEEALELAIRLPDKTLAVAIFNSHKDAILNKEQFNRLNQLVRMFPEHVLVNTPSLLLARALLFEIQKDYVQLEHYLDRANSLLQKEEDIAFKEDQLSGEYYALKACSAYLAGRNHKAGEYSDAALKLLPGNQSYIRDFGTVYKAMSLKSAQSTQESILFLDGILKGSSHDRTLRKIRIDSCKAVIYSMDWNLDALRQTALSYYEPSTEKNLMISWVMSTYFLGLSHYHSNQLEKACGILSPLVQSNYFGRPFWNLFAWHLYLCSLVGLGKKEEYITHLKQLDDLASKFNNEHISQFVRCIKADIAILGGDLVSAEEFISDLDVSWFPIAFFSYFPQLTRIKFLLHSPNPELLEQAGAALDHLMNRAKEMNNKTLSIQLLTLKAIYFEKTNSFKNAREHLEKSIALNGNSFNIRTYLDLGKLLIKSVGRLPEDPNASDLYKEVLHLFKNKKYINTSFTRNRSMVQVLSAPVVLTEREKEILIFVTNGMQNAQIALHLFITEDTVKKHLYHTYKKLGVRNRIGAILKAKELNLF